MVEALLHGEPNSLPPLTLLVHPNVARLSGEMRRLHERQHWPLLAVGPRVAATIVALPPRQRPRAAEAALEEAIASMGGACILVDQIDLLFEPSLELDPLKLLTRLSRRARLVVAWPGEYSGGAPSGTLAAQGMLAYAVPQHGHYRTWQDPPGRIIALVDTP